ncbi:MAG TPA: cyclic-di-AMP receptor [Brevefilum sp.]|nr:cyclic-di-AMP receptor [Brevefilum sp.]
MKMVMVVVPANASEKLLDALVNAGHTATYTETRGGMLRQSQYSLFVVVQNEQLEEVMGVIRDNCHIQVEMKTHLSTDQASLEKQALTAEIGGAVAFVWDIEKFESFS